MRSSTWVCCITRDKAIHDDVQAHMWGLPAAANGHKKAG